ncbi:ferrochelatase [Cohnella xylanilytica]|uniref:Coproporphyrin III ferrochelatase n=1 Tax=Cohnella xylanilytica TaxID=557555 RepID=A0A841TXD5_9BACL|nr:ferrochelatase [Cohnella xylanilytica]MBB6690601.1 ferrochelatase [Cohnella xylanilytica]GIO15051.1 ferrochelatase [Cohnella xylanilytica]
MSDHSNPVGVLVMSYGTPESMEGVEAYYTHIRRGHPPTAEQLEDLTSRYRAIVGGVFPLRENTNRQAAALQRTLDELAGAGAYKCYQGLKHAAPFIEDGVAAMAEDGVKEAVAIVLTPQYSSMSVGGYMKRAKEEAEKRGIRLATVESYHLHPELISALAKRVSEGLDKFGDGRGDALVLFSAHSLPEKILELKDPYPEQLLETSRAVAGLAGVERWQFTWQSAGQTGQPWLGPDILDTLDALAREGTKNVLVAPVGFVSDHLEVLYDIDIEARRFSEERGIRLERIAMLNDDPQYMKALAESVLEASKR